MIYSSFGIVEIGSTNTKGYVYKNNKVSELNFCNINFKKNYNAYGSIIEEDRIKLLDYIKSIKTHTENIFIFGTSIFRQLPQNELDEFVFWLQQNTNASFKVVSAAEENQYTVRGIIKSIEEDETVAVMIGGGGSTEISICQNKAIIEQANSSFGVVNVQDQFPTLSHNTTDIALETVVDYVISNLKFPVNKSKTLILAGGNFILRYEKALYPIEKNTLFSDINCPYMIETIDNISYDKKYFNNISLDELRKKTPNTPKWWDGTRAMCACVDAVAKILESKILIPTNITMVYGIIDEIINNSQI